MTDTLGQGWFTDVRKIFLTQALTVILTPTCVALTLYMIERSKAPKPDLQYVSATPEYFVIEPSASLVASINNDPGLSSELRSELLQANPTKDSSSSCSSWLDGGSWDANCLGVYKSVSNQIRGNLLGIVSQGHGSIQEARAKSSLVIIEGLRKELTRVENANQPRAGNVSMTVGVLNVGDADGTIFSTASLTFNGKTMDVSAERYTPISAHGFSEIEFTTPREDAGTFFGTFTDGQQPVIKAWSDLVKSGAEIPFQLTLTLSEKKAEIKGTVPKQE